MNWIEPKCVVVDLGRIVSFVLLLACVSCRTRECARTVEPGTTFCNPLNVNYRFQKRSKLVREAADPVMHFYKGDYYLFASKSGGYWWSNDMIDWTLVMPDNIPIEGYAPAVFEYEGDLYFMSSWGRKLYKTNTPKQPDSWGYVGAIRGDTDPALFLDDDGRVYLYYGCHENGPIWGVELDPENQFKEIGTPASCLVSKFLERGWEVAGDSNTGGRYKGKATIDPWIEGAWMTKHEGKYYLQYAGPGTQYTSYADGIYVADAPLGPFTYCEYSPASFCPTGFSPGAGHGCTFTDKDGAYWRCVTGVISVRHIFERRLNLFPAGFTKDGDMFTNTYLADHPQYLPGCKASPEANNLVGWMLLSYKKSASASTTQEEHPMEQAFDENIKTYWSAETGNAGEWLQVDLGNVCTIHAIQVNFAEENTVGDFSVRNDPHQYVVDVSDNGTTWTTFVDKSANENDAPHDYVQLEEVVKGRYLKITNVHMPFGGFFAVRGLRVFGNAGGEKPRAVEGFEVLRNKTDGRSATLSWQPAKDRNGIVVRYGIAPDKLHNSYIVRDQDSLTINSLNRHTTYYFTVDALNENGITSGQTTLKSMP